MASLEAELVSHECSTVTPGDVCMEQGGSCAGVSVLSEHKLT